MIVAQIVGEETIQAPNPDYHIWMQQDQIIPSTLLSSLSPEILSHVLLLESTIEVWRALKRMFSSRSRAWMIQIRMQFFNTHKNDLSTVAYFAKTKALADTLASTSHPLRDEEFISYLLAGLDVDYNPLVTSITTRTDALTISDVYAHLLNFEMHLDQQNSTMTQFSGFSVSFANCGGNHEWRGRG